jgi:hypothetical protein
VLPPRWRLPNDVNRLKWSAKPASQAPTEIDNDVVPSATDRQTAIKHFEFIELLDYASTLGFDHQAPSRDKQFAR